MQVLCHLKVQLASIAGILARPMWESFAGNTSPVVMNNRVDIQHTGSDSSLYTLGRMPRCNIVSEKSTGRTITEHARPAAWLRGSGARIRVSKLRFSPEIWWLGGRRVRVISGGDKTRRCAASLGHNAAVWSQTGTAGAGCCCCCCSDECRGDAIMRWRPTQSRRTTSRRTTVPQPCLGAPSVHMPHTQACVYSSEI